MFIVFNCISFSSDSDEDAPQLYNDNKHCPIFKSTTLCFSNTEAFRLILDPRMDIVCTEMPIGCKSISTFLLDTPYFQHTLDIRADDNGKWHGITMEENQSSQVSMIMEMSTTLRRNQELLHWLSTGCIDPNGHIPGILNSKEEWLN